MRCGSLLGVVLAVAAGCARAPADTTPEGAVELFLRATDDASRDPAAAARAFSLLDPRAREALRARAARATSIDGRPLAPESMLAPSWSPPRFEVETLRAVPAADGIHASVDVLGVDPAAQHAKVPVVREGDRWRIVLQIEDPSP